MLTGRTVRAHRWTLALGTSVAAMGVATATPAAAQCTPDPTVAGGTTTCTGTDADGLTVTTYGTTVVIGSGASVLGAGAPAIAVRLPSGTYGNPVTVSVAGRVDGVTAAGVSLLWQPASSGFSYSDANLTMTIAQGGSVGGTNAVVVGQSGSGYGYAYARIDNAGTLTDSSGIALLSTAPGYASFSSITNRATGTIGAISGPVGALDNAGTITGGTRSAIDWGTAYSYGYGTLANSGTITATSSAATLANLPSGRTLSNSGTITNSGTGAAIAGDGGTITNATGGRIASAGTTAISTTRYVNLTNAGTVAGDVRTGVGSDSFYGSTIDSRAGTINGNVIFGAGPDTLVAGYDGTRLVTGITGTIDGGAGTDTVRVQLAGDTTLAGTLTLPTAFERLSLAPDAKVTATLADGFSAPGPILLEGNGTIVNRTTLSAATQVVATPYLSGRSEYPSFVNAGTIRTTAGVSGSFAVDLGYAFNRFENSGSIVASGDGVRLTSGSFTNAGTITAAGTGVSQFGSDLTNSGTIRSTGGIGAILSGSYYTGFANSGRIEGATAGVQLGATLVNTGTITSARAGVILDSYGILDNRAGGVVTGGTAGVTVTSYPYGATVANAGTINGDVRIAGTSSYSYYGSRYFAFAGGVLNGNLTLGTNDALVAELANTGPGAFAGITGTVAASGSLLRYRVRSDATATLAGPAGFAGVGYDLYDDAMLTLSGSTSRSVALAGTGTVDLSVDITATGGQPAISVTSVLTAPGETAPTSPVLAITSRGALLLEHTDTSTYPYGAVVLSGADSFTNAGTITVRERATPVYSRINAIAGGKTVLNSGTITLDGATGVSGAATLTNSGSILQATGGRAAIGVSNVGTLTNSGTIDVAGTAVLVDYPTRTITNTGRIASSGAAAITTAQYGSSYGLTITNAAGGTIAGGTGQNAIQIGGGTLRNAGTITGSVDLGYSSYGRYYASAVYAAEGGTITGDLRFGEGDDTLVTLNDTTGVSGTIDGGAGRDILIRARDTTGTVTLGLAGVSNFELQGVRALGVDTVVTASAANLVASALYLSGDGSIVNTATINGAVYTDSPTYNFGDTVADLRLAGFTNQGSIRDGAFVTARSVANSGTIGSATLAGRAVSATGTTALTFANSGTITNSAVSPAVTLYAYEGSLDATNSGTITGGLSAEAGAYYDVSGDVRHTASLVNSGTITGPNRAVSLTALDWQGTGGGVSLSNSGTIESTSAGGRGAYFAILDYGPVVNGTASTIDVVNSGTIRSNAGGVVRESRFGTTVYRTTAAATGLTLYANGGTATVANAAGGVIEATGARSTALLVFDSGLTLTNAGMISGGAGTTLTNDDGLADALGATQLAGAIQTAGGMDDRIVNTGTIVGSIALGGGNDRIENRGTIRGNVALGSGDDTFLQLASATLVGTVDGGTGTDSLVVDATGGGAVNGDQFINFERFSQIGQGNVAYSGAFRFDTIGVSGGDVTVNAGQTLSSTGPVTITGSDAAETVVNNGTIAGSVELAGGNDRLVNAGVILGSVALGSGDDQFVEGVGSRVSGTVTGGAGNDLYTVILAGDRRGIGQRSGFERLGVEGTGTLSLTLDQDFAGVVLAGTGLSLTLAGYRVGAVTGSAAAETLTVDDDIADVALAGGNDQLAIGTTRATGRYDGGRGTDILRFTAAAPVTLAGSATGFEQVVLAGNALTIAGTLGSSGAPLSFGDGDQRITLASGGTLAGVIDLGAGNDSLRLDAGGTLAGTVAGGAGTDLATIVLAGDRTLAADTLTGFETLASEGTGTLSLSGAQSYDQVSAGTDVAILAGASLTARQVTFGAGDNRFAINGGFAGSVDGGAGSDGIDVAGGSATTPVAFGNIANVEAMRMSAGYATVSGNAALTSIALSGGRLVGVAGSTITAPTIGVAQGATFGSAGIVTGNIAVAGTLSPGASPGTMTVNGNVALAGSSLSVFEITPTVSDKLLVNGTVTIASGATLQLVPSQAITPGSALDLIVASGGITGSFTTVTKPASLFGFLVQDANRIRLLGQFLNSATFSRPVQRSIDYLNGVLTSGRATPALLAAVPQLVTSSGASNTAAFAQLTPEPYAAARQISVENGLTLADAARGAGFAANRETPGLFAFASALGSLRTLDVDTRRGTTQTQTNSYGFLGGIGVAGETWSIGAFGGYLNDWQHLASLGARTKADGVVAGVHARVRQGGVGLKATVAYDGADAHTRRVVPGRVVFGGYRLRGWTADASVDYAVPVGDWTVRPSVGATTIRATRGSTTETGGSPFALSVARRRDTATFVDGTVTFDGGRGWLGGVLHPYLTIGGRYQVEGRGSIAVAGLGGGGVSLVADGARRAPVVATAAIGADVALSPRLALFGVASGESGDADHRAAGRVGVRFAF